VTWEQADAERYVAEAMASDTVDAIVAAGGDGTVNEVLTAGRKNDIALPVLSLNKSCNTPHSAWQATRCLCRFLSHELCMHLRRAQITILGNQNKMMHSSTLCRLPALLSSWMHRSLCPWQ